MLNLRTKLRYRLYGTKGVTPKEFNKLVDLGVIKRREQTIDEEVCYDHDCDVTIEPGEPTLSEEFELPQNPDENQGFELMPLDPILSGRK